MRSPLGRAAALLALLPAAISAQRVGEARVVPIQVTGDPAARFSMVVLSDGYTAAELGLFREQLDRHLNILWSMEPFRSYRNYVNLYAVEIVSGESGITCDPAHRQQRNTPLSMRFGGGCENPNARGVSVDQAAARRYAEMATPDYDQILAIANTDTYGGIGGRVATTTGGNAISPYITIHELGHSLGRLQDEYTYRARGVMGGTYTGDEPNSAHHTIMTEQEMLELRAKWWRWLGEPSEAGGLIGRFEGGQSSVAGIRRPSKHSLMISLGYYFDQVSRERMTRRISAQVELIPDGTPVDAPVRPDRVLWIRTAHPVFHELEVTWTLDGQPIASTANRRQLDLRELGLGAGQHTVTVTVVDPTPFVRDPAIRDSTLTVRRSWTVAANAPATPAAAQPLAFTAWTDTAGAVAAGEVIYVETTHPPNRVVQVRWTVDGRPVDPGADSHSLALGELDMAPGTHRVTAAIDGAPGAGTISWLVDNTLPNVIYTLGTPVASADDETGMPHYLVRDSFTMKLEATDDQPGFVVAEFRVNGDGWHHYYGWPDAPPGTPFLFTPRGTNIKELIYGSLGAEGLSPQPWEERAPGWGTHTIEYRARDAAGNIGETRAFRVTVVPGSACTTVVTGTHSGPLDAGSGVTCVRGATIGGPVTVRPGASLVVTGATLRGGVDASGANAIEIADSRVDGRLRVRATSGHLVLLGNTLAAEPELADNEPAIAATLAGNRVGARDQE